MSQQASRLTILITLTALLAGASYLYAVRGTAILFDLSALAAGLLCF